MAASAFAARDISVHVAIQKRFSMDRGHNMESFGTPFARNVERFALPSQRVQPVPGRRRKGERDAS